MIQKLLKNALIVFFVLLLPLAAFPYDSDIVHPAINEAASRRSANLATVLQMLGFNGGVDSFVNGRRIFWWFQDGGTLEDKPTCQTKFHFHDPTQPFDQAGLSNIAIDSYCRNYNHRSSLVWAQDTDDNLWSWQQARLYYLAALTGANKDIREEKFAATFRSLGQVMHLVSDASVPAHARNDIHIFPVPIPGLNIPIGRPTYESWAKANPSKLSYTGVQIGQSIFNEAVDDSLAPVPISALWDQNKYTGYNPADAVGTNIGIAEYTNANFFSEDTIFKNFTYPSRDSVTQVSYEINDPRNPSGKVLREYYQKIAHGDTGYRLATVGFLKDYLFTFLPDQVITLSLFEKPALDGEVYGDYAARLVPRAVGYSAGLLDYFFRGKLDIKQTDIKSNGDIEITITNFSDEPLVDGVFELYYDNPNGERVKLPLNDSSAQNILKGDSKKTTFAPPAEFESSKNNKCMLVYRGQLGEEKEAVIGNQATLGVEYHWALVFDYPGLSLVNYQFSETPGTWTDCGTIAGAVMIATKTYTCPKTGSVKAYLILSDHPIPNRAVSGGCADNLISMYIGQFSKKDILSKIYYQNEYYDTYWKMTHDPDEVLMCPLRTGEMAYPLASYAVKRTDPMAQIAWREVPIDLPELAKIKTIFPASQNIIMAYEGDSFNNDVYGIIQSTDNFSYPVTIFIEDYAYHCHWDLLTKTETEICYCIDYCPPDSPYCFNVVGIVPGSYQERKRLRILIPDTGFEYFFSF